MRIKIIILLAFVLITCGKPADRMSDLNNNLNQQINFEIKLDSTSGEINNIFYISKNLEEIKIEKIPYNNIQLQTLSYGETDIFKFKIENMDEIEVCYSPTEYIFKNSENSLSIIYITYNNAYNTVKISGDGVKDVQISISEKIIDDTAYWTRNDKFYSSNC